jgi:CheY-like chemotaxis protein
MLFEMFPQVETMFFTMGNEYLDYLNSSDYSEPNLIFIDIRLPEYSGLELIEKLIALENSAINTARVFVLSSTLNNRDIEKSKSFKVVEDFIEKPLTFDRLNEIMQ